MPRPTGTVRLLRKYNPASDDHAIFPEVAAIFSDMTNQGYTQNSGSDWLGWVYPNYGAKPVVQ
jgi:serine protease